MIEAEENRQNPSCGEIKALGLAKVSRIEERSLVKGRGDSREGRIWVSIKVC